MEAVRTLLQKHQTCTCKKVQSRLSVPENHSKLQVFHLSSFHPHHQWCCQSQLLSLLLHKAKAEWVQFLGGEWGWICRTSLLSIHLQQVKTVIKKSEIGLLLPAVVLSACHSKVVSPGTVYCFLIASESTVPRYGPVSEFTLFICQLPWWHGPWQLTRPRSSLALITR